MPSEAKPNALAQHGNIIGPVGGVLVALLLIAAVAATDNVSDAKNKLAAENTRVKAALESTEVNNDPPGLEGPGQVKPTLEAGKGNVEALPAAADGLLRTPIAWDVKLDEGDTPEFERYDENRDTYWDEQEFRRTPYFNEPPPVGDFKAWDKDTDGRISRTEYDNRPGSPEENFERLDKNGDKVLDEKDGISAQEIRDKDFDQDGKVTLEEYIRWTKEGPPKIYAFGEPSGLTATLDPRNMTINLSWNGVPGDRLPDDLGYFILRRAPEYLERAKSEHGKRVQEWVRLNDAWEKRMKSWLDSPAKLKDGKPHPEGEADPAKKNFRAYVGRTVADQRRAYQEYMKASGEPDPAPVQPKEPAEWDVINTTPIVGTSYSTSNFELDITYTFAVMACTLRDLDKGAKFNNYELGDQVYKVSAQSMQEGHPLRVRSRIEMADGGLATAEGMGKIRLTRTINVTSGETTNWYRASIELEVGENQPLGAVYTMSELRQRGLKLVDLAGTDANIEILPGETRLNFETGYRFDAKNAAVNFLRHPQYGSFELNQFTKGPPTVIPDVSGSNPAEVWLVGLANKGKSAHFEIARWHQVGDKWYLVMLNVKADTGKAIGREVDLSNPGADVVVKDSSGADVSAATLRGDAFKGQTVNLAVGNYEGVDKRTAKIDGKEFDIFATLYVD